MTIALAFYRGKGDWIDATIRAVTRSEFSHVELVRSQSADLLGRFDIIGASWRDRGVRERTMPLDREHWTLLPVPWATDRAYDRAAQHLGARYDLVGVMFSQLLALRREDDSRWFCSELCAYALRLGAPETFSPGSLFSAVQDLNRVWVQGATQDFGPGPV